MSLHVQNQPFEAHISAKRAPVGVSDSSLRLAATPAHRHLSSLLDLEEPSPLPLGWQKFLDLQTGEIYYSKTGEKGSIALDQEEMSKRNGPKLDLKLNLSPPRMLSNPLVESPSRSLTVSPTSPPSSCVSSERNLDESPRYASSPEATSMMLVGCPRCLMYVMLAEEDPRCPKCKSTVLLDVIPDSDTINNTTTGRKTKKS
ncbi:protein GL2-INTERACTING REPRESSOR 1 isoform X1 [Primulina huaijiensis]|uniref:protein GL2-INTERACTING REPRESSOR 1 isoform X1 n=2 Tax=Primulina huaijiensis TaxID=1492673 RepID=UPI003CC78A7A